MASRDTGSPIATDFVTAARSSKMFLSYRTIVSAHIQLNTAKLIWTLQEKMQKNALEQLFKVEDVHVFLDG